ncbi:hypothetical protein D3C81_1429020 [compost metagenome]
MFRRRVVVQAVGDVAAGHGTVAGEVLGLGGGHLFFNGPRQLAREGVGLVFYAVGAVVAGAAFEGEDLRVRHQLQHLVGLRADLLHPLVAGHLPGDLAQRYLEVGLQQAGAVAFVEVLEGVEEVVAHQRHLIVAGKHQGQLLLEHQHAGGHGGDQVPALARHPCQHRDIERLETAHAFQVAEFELGHAAAAFPLDQADGNGVVRQHGGQVFDYARIGVVAIAGGEEGDLAPGAPGDLGGAGAVQGLQPSARTGGVVAGHPRLGIHIQGLFQQLARGRIAVGGIDRLRHHRDGCQPPDRPCAGKYPRR